MAVDYTAWLNDPAAVRVTLIEVGVKVAGLETTRYLSTKPYNTGPSDVPANQHYAPIVTTGVQFTEQLDLDGAGSMSVGDIEIANYNGERDAWLDDIWDNHSIKAWIGDPRWARSDYRLIFNGIVGTINSKSRDVLNLVLLDKLQQLNTPITDVKIGGTGTNKDDIFNLSFGEVSNITPQITNEVTLEYQYHDSSAAGIIEVRDNGKPIANDSIGWSGITISSPGRFCLTHPAAGTITCSVQGDNNNGASYTNTIAGIVKRVTTGYGTATSRFTTEDLDLTNLDAFDAANPQPVGVYAEGRTNVLQMCQDLASSLGAQLIMSRLGKLRLIQLRVPGTGTPVVITGSQMVERSFKINSRPLVQSSVMLGFDKNWTVQEGLLTSIPDAHKQMFATEWLTATVTSTDVQAAYKLNAAPVQEDTMLCTRVDAMNEAQRRLTVWSTARSELTFEGTSDLLQTLELGMAVTIINRRFGLQNGKTGIVTSLAPNWLTGRVVVGVLV